MRRISLASALVVVFALAPRGAALAGDDKPPLVPPPAGHSTGGDDEDTSYRWYGLGGGASVQLDPTDGPGGWVQASAALDLSPRRGSALLGVRGAISASFSADGWAVLPLLSGDAGFSLGPLDLFLTGGVQIFGFARRAQFTAFTSFGLLGGGGFAVRLGPRFRLALRAQVIWLPSRAAGKIDADETTPKPTFLYLTGGLVFEVRQLFKEL
ncbi:MAG: hypothetical protein KC503_23195 [Myxococcales bacterium]|nr:hypothetical protein [Myxococcales bacterium]